MEIRKRLWDEVKQLRLEGKLLSLIIARLLLGIKEKNNLNKLVTYIF